MAKVARIPPVPSGMIQSAPQCEVCGKHWHREAMWQVTEPFDAMRPLGRRMELMRVQPGNYVCSVHVPEAIRREAAA